MLLVQLSDSHLFAEADGKLLGMDTCESLKRVIEQVRLEQPGIDLILAPGDLSQDGTQASYQNFRTLTAGLDAPVRWLAGNHDELTPMQDVCKGTDLLEPVVDLGAWRVIMLDSSIPGAVPGLLADDQLQLLEQALSEAPQRHHLVCLHHHPVPIGCKWMDPIGLRNPMRCSPSCSVIHKLEPCSGAMCTRRSTSNTTACACSPRPPPACSSPPAARSSRSATRHPATAGCACMTTARWKLVYRASTGIHFEVDYSIKGY